MAKYSSVPVDNAIVITTASNNTDPQAFISLWFAGDVLNIPMRFQLVLLVTTTNTGVLSFTGSVAPADLQTIFRNVKIRSNSTNPQNR
jgi:hypothetical protein